jgi:hypothetical protein
MKYQYVIFCLKDSDSDPKDNFTYVQATRKRFIDEESAKYRMGNIAVSRFPFVAKVPAVDIDADGYPC